MAIQLSEAYDQIHTLLNVAYTNPEKAHEAFVEMAELIVSQRLEIERLDGAARQAIGKLTYDVSLALTTLLHGVQLAASNIAVVAPTEVKKEAAKVVAGAAMTEAIKVAANKLSEDAEVAARLVTDTAKLTAIKLAITNGNSPE